MVKSLKFCLFAVVFVFGLCSITNGQVTTGTVAGTVKDQKGAVVPGVSVALHGTNVGFDRTTQTNGDGFYKFIQVPAGIYKVTVAASSGFAETSVDQVSVVIEKTTTADVTLGITQTVTAVEVQGDPLGVVVDPTDSKVQTNITSRLIEDLPKGTNITTVLKAVPAVRPEPLSGGYQVDGASGSENTFLIDGQALENFRTGVLNVNNNIPTTLVQEVQVKVGGFEAEHGGASGAVVSIATKGGTDQWRGEFGNQWQTSGLQAGPRFAPSYEFDPSGDAVQRLYGVRQLKDHYTNFFPTVSLGGPIIKKRIWFYGNYSPQIYPLTRTVNYYRSVDDTSFASGTVNQAPAGVASGVKLVSNATTPQQTFKATTKNEYAFGRIDAQIFSQLRYSGTYLWNPTIDDGQIPYGTIAVGGTPRSTSDYALRGGRTNSNNFTSQLTYTPTSRLVVTARYARAFLNEKDGNYNIAGGPWYRCLGVSSVYAGINTGCAYGYNSGATPNVLRDVSLKNEFNADASYIVNEFVGSHIFKGGYQYGAVKNDVAGSSFSDPYYGRQGLYYGRNFDYLGYGSYNSFCNLRTAANPNGDCLGVGSLLRYGTSGIGKNRYQAIYVQDKWQPITNLTLNLGIRFENENLPAFNTGGGRGGLPIKFGWGKKIAPRLGFSWDPWGSGKTRIFGSYGLFYDRLKFELPRGSFGGDFYRYDIFPIKAAHPEYTYYVTPNILGSWNDPIGGGNPSTAGGLSLLQVDYRIPSNITQQQAEALGLPFTGVDPNLKPFRQSEITFGFERELKSNYVFSARYTRKNVDSAIEDHGILGDNYSENYIIGNPGEGFDYQLDRAAGYDKSLKPERLYNGLEIVLNKRLSHHYYYNVNYTLSRLYGNYSGLASSDENGRTSPGVNRFFDYIVNGFTFTGQPDNGDLPTDRRHALKAYGGYELDWFGSKTNSTEFSFFQQILQGTPLTTFIGIQNSDMVFSKRGDLGRSPTFWQTDFSLTHRYKFGKDGRFTVAFDLNILNLFNNNAVLLVQSDDVRYASNNTVDFSAIDPTYDTTGNAAGPFNRILNGQFPPSMVDAYLSSLEGNPRSILYGQPRAYQSSRNVRFGVRFYF